MKEVKNVQLKFRLTASLKEKIEKYCAANGLNVSEFMRMACEEIVDKEESRND